MTRKTASRPKRNRIDETDEPEKSTPPGSDFAKATSDKSSRQGRPGWRGVAFFVVLLLIVVACLARLLIGSGNWGTLFWITLGYLLYELSLNCYLTAGAYWAVPRVLRRRQHRSNSDKVGPALTVAIAAHNEENAIVATIEKLLAQTGAEFDLIVVSNGSSDQTVAVVRETFQLIPSAGLDDLAEGEVWHGIANQRAITLRQQEKKGKAAALNWAIQRAHNPVVVTLDADTHLRPGALQALSSAFANPETKAAGGFLYVRDADHAGWLVRFQFVEYLKAFMWRLGFAEANVCLQVSGAFAGFRRDTLLELGLFDETSLVEDYEIIFRLHAHYREQGIPYHVGVVEEAVADTEVPYQITQFVRQRTRWFCGFLQTLWAYRGMVWQERYGLMGLLMLPIKCVDAILPLWGIAALTIFLLVLVSGHETFELLALQMFCVKYVLEFGLTWVVLQLEHTLGARPATEPVRPWQILCLFLDGVTFNWFRQFAVAQAYVDFVRRARRWDPSVRRTVPEEAGSVVSAR